MAGSILARHRREALDFTTMMTVAQRAAVMAQLASHPAARADPVAAARIAAEAGFPVADQKPERGLAAALAYHLKG